MIFIHCQVCFEIVYIIILCQISGSNVVNNTLVLKSCCTYPGYTSTYECTVVGTPFGATVWRGSAFNCLSQEITLLHRKFTENIVYGVCNNGSIVGRGLWTENGCYTSQLNVTVNSDVSGKSIECVYDGGDNIVTTIGSLNIMTSEIHPPSSIGRPWPSGLDSESNAISFNWCQSSLGCPPIHYIILASNCGICPITTNLTTVTCTGVPTDGGVCIFAVQTVFCGNISGEVSRSDIIKVNLSVLGTPPEKISRTTPFGDIDIRFYATLSSASFLFILFLVSTFVFVTIVILLKRKTKVRGSLELAVKTDIPETFRSTKDIIANENIAYGHLTNIGISVD